MLPRPDCRLTLWLFLRLLALVYGIAFVSLWVQIDGLIGAQGIRPVADYLAALHERFGGESYRLLPTLCWLDASDGFLHLLCGAGTLLALLLLFDLVALPALAGLWVAYLSLVLAGQTFLSFQWDSLLLETGLVALFVAPARLRPRWPWSGPPPSRAGLWLVRFLLFKLMFLSGVVKLLSLDDSWWELTALAHHYFTQPLPPWTAWYAHGLPAWFGRLSVAVMFAIELGAPLLLFCGRRLRQLGTVALIALQLLIAATGNYGFFNLLSLVLCLAALDDDGWLRLAPRLARSAIPRAPAPVPSGRRAALRRVRTGLAVVLAALSACALAQELVRTAPPVGLAAPTRWALAFAERTVVRWSEPWMSRFVDPFRSVNGYGLFRVMTTERPEIAVEGSADGERWIEYAFRWKPGDPARRPGFVAPHQPRLDWQMWFAALSPRRAAPWLDGLLRRLLEGSPAVLGLLADDPFDGTRPRYVRLVRYRYRFTTPAERRATGHWWVRELEGYLTGRVELAPRGAGVRVAP